VIQATVLWGSQNIYQVETHEENPRFLECRFKGKKLKLASLEYNPLAPGDDVIIEVDERNSCMILERLPRKNSLERWNRKRERPQTLAANIDLMVIVGSFGVPPFRPRFIDRCLALAEYSHLEVFILLNKAELGISDAEAERLLSYQRLGYPVHLCSVNAQEGLKELEHLWAAKRVLLMGQSGVGKSSLLKHFDPAIETKIGEVNEKYSRGNHTTTLARMWPVKPFAGLIDTPGIRQLDLPDMEAQELAFMFRDFLDFIPLCKLRNCTHRDEPSCGVQKGLKEGLIHQDRYVSYRNIIDHLGD